MKKPKPSPDQQGKNDKICKAGAYEVALSKTGCKTAAKLYFRMLCYASRLSHFDKEAMTGLVNIMKSRRGILVCLNLSDGSRPRNSFKLLTDKGLMTVDDQGSVVLQVDPLVLLSKPAPLVAPAYPPASSGPKLDKQLGEMIISRLVKASESATDNTVKENYEAFVAYLRKGIEQ